ncbi:hypothetical protein BH11CYA1_BH11CYA1_23220 [soil metagenome]
MHGHNENNHVIRSNCSYLNASVEKTKVTMEDSQSSSSSSNNSGTVKESDDPLPGPLNCLFSSFAFGKKGDGQRS